MDDQQRRPDLARDWRRGEQNPNIPAAEFHHSTAPQQGLVDPDEGPGLDGPEQELNC